MLCACSGEQFKVEEPISRSPESLATRDFSASGLSSRTGTGDWDSKFEDAQVDEAESTLKEALSLNYEEARALLGRLEYQKGNFDAALQVFYGIDIKSLSPRMIKAISDRTLQHNVKSKREITMVGLMSLHSVSLLLEAILLKAKSLQEMSKFKEAAKECKMILDIVESALPNGMPDSMTEDCKLQEMFHKALELLPVLWIEAGDLKEAIAAYRRALVKPWNLDPQRLSALQKDLAAILLYGGVETTVPQAKTWDACYPTTNTEEALLLLFILMKKLSCGEIRWDPEIISHLSFALSTCDQFECLAVHVEQLLPRAYKRIERWFFLALCYSAAGQTESALNILKKISGSSESEHEPHIASLLLGAKLCSQDPNHAHEGINFARKVIESSDPKNEHFKSITHKFLGVNYGNAARVSLSDSGRVFYHEESINSLNAAASVGVNDDPEVVFYLGLENAIQRNLDVAFSKMILYSDMVAGSSSKGFTLLALILSAEQRFKDAETIVDIAWDETGRVDQLELLRLKAVLQIAQQQPKQAIETYKILLALIQARGGELRSKNMGSEAMERKLEIEAWLDLANIYTKLESTSDAEICVNKARSKEFYHPGAWHSTGLLFEAQSLHNEALIAFSVALSIEPDHVPSIISTAETLMEMGGSETLPIARSFLMNSLRLEPTNHDAWFNLALICKKEGLEQQAADFFQAAHELESSAPVQSFA
ncbi:putative tetratricopeptide-like helical domain superfamily, protein NPG1 [Helianthus annuus]|uniref:Putative no pollen germination related 1 n=1 Tax=Helianthus annuus TaxID=4232 RepID=A0A251TZL3_HELAN|nr:protein NPGR1 [Helianthus annuus]XP_021983492.1 protein NPGR1 [Helianthus annuus]XP_021983494.1 protein NPGR1 [Helianthus annuus]KAF5792222.1 putative tetratricopeptide-like helical domain superfamily [Helianthus annuus]KAJ0527187.1 putative tetratricopeptide-like helical domain superfamily, protein NPG1 [Helianthus annuus]KAJ0543592.1 putative tetratricopeptide-like helical domain superfamily, protein NPG1 [Helianthus annuus]KAJ0708646.1 putative tetratricopeptide-like helical domain supe